MTRRIQIGGEVVEITAPDIETRLESAFARRERPLCLCCAAGSPLYVARVSGRHVLKRMPGTGKSHDFDCPSYDPPTALSGLGGVASGAVVENADKGTTMLKLAFSMEKVPGRAARSIREAVDAGETSPEGAGLSLRALLHYLWEQAGFNRWRPAMAGRRNWAVIRKFILEAAEHKSANGKQLTDVLYIPEMFNKERKAAIVRRRAIFLNQAIQTGAKRRTLALLIGEIKEITPARFGHRVIIKHVPRFPFMLSQETCRRLSTTFATELALWNALEDAHLIAVATFGIDAAGIASIEAIALMTATDRWMPVDNHYEATLIDTLARRGAKFVKGLRYDLPATQPMASVVLGRGKEAPVALYVVPENAPPTYHVALCELIEQSGMASWIWKTDNGPLPELPR